MTIHDAAKKLRQNTHDVLPELIYRWSPRKMTGEDIASAELEILFAAAQWAPSAYNNQPWRFYYAHRDTDGFKKLVSTLGEFNQQWTATAAVLMVVVSKNTFDYNGEPDDAHSFVSGAAMEALMIEGSRRNLVVHGMQIDRVKAKKVLGLSDEYTVEAMVAVGKPSDEIVTEEISQRRPLSEIAIEVK